jgi:hypothetical protein
MSCVVLAFTVRRPDQSADLVVGRCEVVLDIAQFGSTRSINAGAAAAIAMHAWVRQHVFDQSVVS